MSRTRLCSQSPRSTSGTPALPSTPRRDASPWAGCCAGHIYSAVAVIYNNIYNIYRGDREGAGHVWSHAPTLAPSHEGRATVSLPAEIVFSFR